MSDSHDTLPSQRMTYPTLTYAVRFTAILVSRFLLDLQAVNQKSLRVARDDPLHSSRMDASNDSRLGANSLVFAGFDVVGSLGASLAPSEHASDCVEDAEFEEVDDGEELGRDGTAFGENGTPGQQTLEGSVSAACVVVATASQSV